MRMKKSKFESGRQAAKILAIMAAVSCVTSLLVGDGTPLQGAEFQLLDYDLSEHDFGKDAITGDSLTSRYLQASDIEGVFFIGRLPLGIYYLKETTAPAGYAAPTEGLYYKLTVPETGEVTMAATPEQPGAESGDAGD